MSKPKKCRRPIRVNTDVDEHEIWHCVKDAGHRDNHYIENADGSEGMAHELSPTEVAYWEGYAACEAARDRT